MANINIERKRRGIWPYIVGLILLVAVIWVAARLIGEDGADQPVQVEPARE